MNNSKKLPIIIAAVIAVVALILGGIFFLNQNKPGDTTPVPDSTATPSASASPSASAVDRNDPLTKEESQKEYDDSQKIESDVEIANFTKEETDQILTLSSDYAYSTLTNGYYLSGQWDKDGMPNNLNDQFGIYFSSDIREKIKAFDTNPATGTTIGTDVFPLVFFVRPNGPVTPNADCLVKGEEGKALDPDKVFCPLDGVKLSDIKYNSSTSKGSDEPGVNTTFSATAKIPVKFDGKDAYTEVTYDYDLNFIRNEKFVEELDTKKFVINNYNVKVTMGAVVMS